MYQIARNAGVDLARSGAPCKLWISTCLRSGARNWFPPRRDRRKRVARPGSGAVAARDGPVADDKREILAPSRFQGMKYEEIAEVLGCEVGTVKVRGVSGDPRLGADLFCSRKEKVS